MLIEAPELSSFPRIRHAFFTREGGVSDGLYASLNGGLGSDDDPDAVSENRARMADELGLRREALVSLHQIHSAEAVAVDRPWPPTGRPRADGMATATPGIGLAIATADCGPVLFADPHAGVIGAAHAGWKGALGGVLDATIGRMEALGATRGRIVAVLGPTIGPASYEVGSEFVTRFAAEAPGSETFFRRAEREGHASSTCRPSSCGGWRSRGSARPRPSGSAPMPIPPASTATAARPTAASRITGG